MNLIAEPVKKSGLCPYCRNEFTEENEGKIICSDCGVYENAAITQEATYTDLSRIDNSGMNKYKNKETFVKAFDNHTGNSKANFPTELIENFFTYCKNKGIDTQKLTYEKTRPIFKAIEFPNYYNYINLFLTTYANKTENGLSKYRPQIFRDYDLYMKKYPLYKGSGRDSAPNAQYLLYILCVKNGIPCKRTEFKLPDTRSILLELDEISRKVFASFNPPWKFTDTV